MIRKTRKKMFKVLDCLLVAMLLITAVRFSPKVYADDGVENDVPAETAETVEVTEEEIAETVETVEETVPVEAVTVTVEEKETEEAAEAIAAETEEITENVIEETVEAAEEVTEEKTETAEAPAETSEEIPEETVEEVSEYISACVKAEINGYKVSVEGMLKDGTTLALTEVSSSDLSVKGKVIVALDISLIDSDGNEYEPEAGSVLVTIRNSKFENAGNIEVTHISDDGSSESVSAAASGSAVSFEAESFSVYVVSRNGGNSGENDTREIKKYQLIYNRDEKLTEAPTDNNRYESGESAVVQNSSAAAVHDNSGHHLFLGWTTDKTNKMVNTVGQYDRLANSGTFFKPGDNITFKNSDISLHPVWGSAGKLLFTVSYSYTGTVPEGVPAVPGSSSEVYGSSVNVEPAPAAPAGYRFSGWSTGDATVNDGSFVMPSNNVVFTGSFVPLTYTVSYVFTGDVPADATKPQNQTDVPWHTLITPAASVTAESAKDGVPGVWTFNGWTANAAYNEENGVEGNVVFTGTWSFTPAAYKVVFIVDGKIVSETVYNYLDDVAVPEDPTKEPTDKVKYEFVGWVNTETAKTDDIEEKVTRDAEYVALFKEVEIVNPDKDPDDPKPAPSPSHNDTRKHIVNTCVK